MTGRTGRTDGMTGRTDGVGKSGSRPRLSRWLLAGVALVLLGATAFGFWHLVVGGMVNGNPRAGTFGLVLALAAGIPLVIGVWAVRRRDRLSR